MNRLILLLFLALSSNLYALPQENNADAKIIENYLNSITTLSANFLQSNPDGTYAKGKFFLKKPGKIKWEYEDPTPISIVMRKTHVTYLDRKLNQISFAEVEDNLVKLIGDNNIDIDKEGFTLKNVGNKLVLENTSQNHNMRSIKMSFSVNPVRFEAISAVDFDAGETNIKFNNIQSNIKLDDKIFILRKAEKN